MTICTRCAAEIPPPTRPLSERERSILVLLARDFSNAEISGALHLSEKTIKNHLYRIFRVLDVGSRTGAIFAALDLGVISHEEIKREAHRDPRPHTGAELVHAPEPDAADSDPAP